MSGCTCGHHLRAHMTILGDCSVRMPEKVNGLCPCSAYEAAVRPERIVIDGSYVEIVEHGPS